MTETERIAIIDFIAGRPDAGVVIEGGGGARKVRVPKKDSGKSGGYRVITYFMNEDAPVFLLTVISKGQQANLTERQKEAVRNTAKDESRRRRRK